jgi:hypothetical protein
MRSKRSLWASFLTVFLCATSVHAGQQPGVQSGTIPVEFSNRLDRSANGTGGLGIDDPGQILYTEPDDSLGAPNPRDGVDFLANIDEIDAVAPLYDYLFDQIVAGLGELLVSFEGDEGGIAVYSEKNSNSTTKWTRLQLVNTTGADSLQDVDALETHGLLGVFDARMYSVVGDASGVSVYYFDGASSSTFLTRAQVFAAVSALGFTGTEAQVDLDAMMMKDANEDGVWNAGDEVIFSITEAGSFHGGELIHLAFGGAPAFLVHGGHAWNTSFDPALAFNIPGAAKKNADSVDSGQGEPGIPTLSDAALLIALLLLILVGGASMWRRRGALAA